MAAVLLLFAAALPMWADSHQDDLERKIQDLQRQIDELRAERVPAPTETEAVMPSEDTQQPSLSGAESARRWQTYGLSSWTLLDKVAGERTVVGGYGDIEYRGLGSSSTFNQQRLVVGIASRLSDNIFFSAELETEKGGSEGNQKDGEYKVEQGWIEYRLSDALGFRGGIVLVPVGRLNQFHDSPILDLTDRPLVDRLIIPSTWSESGMGLQGNFYPNDKSVLTYEVYAINGLNSKISDAKGTRSARGSFTNDNNDNKGVVGRVGYSPIIGTEFGLAGYRGKYDDDNNSNLNILATDALLARGPFEVRGEWASLHASDAAANGIPARMDGYYIEAAYHFLPKSFRERFTDGTFTAVARYDSVDLDKSVTSSGDKRRITIGLNFRPIEPTVFKLEYQWNRAHGVADEDGVVASAALAF